MFFFSFLCSAIPDLDLGILKMLIRVCFYDVLQPGVYWFIPGKIWLSDFVQWMHSIYSKSLLFASVSYVQVKQTQSWVKVFFFIGGFPLTYHIIWF